MKYSEEIWEQYKDTNYMVSNFGNVKSMGVEYDRFNGHSMIKCIKYPKMLKKELDSRGYPRVTIYIDKKAKHIFVHRMVAETFIPDKRNFKSMPYEDRKNINLDDLFVNHIDENKENNIYTNLEWCTQAYNINYGTRNERMAKKHRKKVLCLETNIIYNSIREAGLINDIQENDIGKACSGKIKSAGGFRWIKI